MSKHLNSDSSPFPPTPFHHTFKSANPLSLISTRALLNEVGSRYDYFVGVFHRTEKAGARQHTHTITSRAEPRMDDLAAKLEQAMLSLIDH